MFQDKEGVTVEDPEWGGTIPPKIFIEEFL